MESVICNTAMGPTHDTACSTCGQPAEKRCTGCIEGVDAYGNPIAVVYCSKTCQKAACPGHKSQCKTANHRKQLYRAGALVQKAFYRLRQAAYDVLIATVEKREGKLHVQEGWYAPRQMLAVFPTEKFVDDDDKYAVLSWRACSDAVTRFLPTVSAALGGMDAKIVELNLLLRVGQERIVFHNADGSRQPELPYIHQIFQVRLKGGETYAFDVSGAQYGLTRSVTPWADYETTTGCHVLASHPIETYLDTWKQELEHELSKNPGLINGTTTQQLIGDHMSFVVKCWSKAKGVSLPALLQDTSSSYTNGCDQLLTMVFREVDLFIDWMQAQGGVAGLPPDFLDKYFAEVPLDTSIDAKVKPVGEKRVIPSEDGAPSVTSPGK